MISLDNLDFEKIADEKCVVFLKQRRAVLVNF